MKDGLSLHSLISTACLIRGIFCFVSSIYPNFPIKLIVSYYFWLYRQKVTAFKSTCHKRSTPKEHTVPCFTDSWKYKKLNYKGLLAKLELKRNLDLQAFLLEARKPWYVPSATNIVFTFSSYRYEPAPPVTETCNKTPLIIQSKNRKHKNLTVAVSPKALNQKRLARLWTYAAVKKNQKKKKILCIKSKAR